MADQKPWERYAASAQAAPVGLPPGAVLIAPPDPVKAYDVPKAQADLRSSALSERRVEQQISMDAATADAQRRTAEYNAQKAALDVRKAGGDLGQQASTRAFERASKLRSDYLSLPSVKNYTQALPVFAAGLQSGDDAAGDLNLIYAYAKVMDPNSVVREGEQASVAGGDTWFNQKTAELQKQLGNGGTFKPEFRQRLRQEMAGRMGELNQSFIADRVNFKQNAVRNGVDPRDVVGDHPGERFQALSKRVLGRDQKQLDFAGNEIATGPTRDVRDPGASKMVDALIRSGAPAEKANEALAALGLAPVDAAQYAAAVSHFRKNPTYKGSYGDITRTVETTPLQRAAASGPAVGFVGALNGATGGLLDEGIGAVTSALTGRPWAETIAEANASKQAGANAHPWWAAGGNLLGGTVSAVGGASLAGRVGASALLGKAAPYVGATAFGAVSGAGENNDNRLLGAGIGSVAGLVGQGAGELLSSPIGALLRTQPAQQAGKRLSGMFGRNYNVPQATSLTSGDAALASALTRAGPDSVRSQLTEAEKLGLPFTLADTHPELRELGGAVVRQSPSASSVAENALMARSRGQIDRLGAAVQRDLGPIGNTLELSTSLRDQARTAAAPLYNRAYQQSIPSTPELNSLLNTPFGREGIAKARTIAANERQSPTELGFALDVNGQPVLNPQPNDLMGKHLFARQELDAAQDAYRAARNGPGDVSAARDRVEAARQGVRDAEFALMQAPDPGAAASVPTYRMNVLDYAKRGMDDVLEQHRNPLTNRLELSDAGRAQNLVKNQFLTELDKRNDAYRQARQVYQGPMESIDALNLGRDLYQPNVGLNQTIASVAGKTPEHLAQTQLGYRDALMTQANKVRYASNPFEATLGTPQAEAKLAAVYPGSEGVANLLRQRDLERGMQQTTTAVLGNSKTAQRQIADAAFAGDDGLNQAIDVGVNLLTGQVPTGVVVKGFTSQKAKDALKFGLGQRAIAKADALAPRLFDTDPQASLANIDDVLQRAQAWQALVDVTRPKRQLGMFGRNSALAGANAWQR